MEQLNNLYLQKFSGNCDGILSDLCEYSKCKIEVNRLTKEKYYSTENMLPNKEGASIASGLPTIEKTTACFKGNVLISNIRPYFKKILYCREESGCSSDVLCFVAKSMNLAPYVYSTLYTDKFFEYMISGAKGTKMPRGDKQQIMQYPIHIPTDDELKEFSTIASSIHNQIEIYCNENRILKIMRDTLLPKLMSGELDVSKIDI